MSDVHEQIYAALIILILNIFRKCHNHIEKNIDSKYSNSKYFQGTSRAGATGTRPTRQGASGSGTARTGGAGEEGEGAEDDRGAVPATVPSPSSPSSSSSPSSGAAGQGRTRAPGGGGRREPAL